jgi:hypothetical protein
MIPEFRNMFMELDVKNLGIKESWKIRILEGFKNLIFRMNLLDSQNQTTDQMNEVFGWKDSEMLNQHDIQEAIRIILNYIENSLKGTALFDKFASILQLFNQRDLQELYSMSEL